MRAYKSRPAPRQSDPTPAQLWFRREQSPSGVNPASGRILSPIEQRAVQRTRITNDSASVGARRKAAVRCRYGSPLKSIAEGLSAGIQHAAWDGAHLLGFDGTAPARERRGRWRASSYGRPPYSRHLRTMESTIVTVTVSALAPSRATICLRPGDVSEIPLASKREVTCDILLLLPSRVPRPGVPPR